MTVASITAVHSIQGQGLFVVRVDLINKLGISWLVRFPLISLLVSSTLNTTYKIVSTGKPLIPYRAVILILISYR